MTAKMDEAQIEALASRLSAAETPAVLRFSVCQIKGVGRGWVTTSSEDVSRLLCDVWNARKALASLLVRARLSGEGK